MRRGRVLGVVTILGALTMAAAASQAPPAAQKPRTIEIQKVRDNLYVFTSSSLADRTLFSGGNVAAFITDRGVVLVDTKLAGWGQALLDDLRTVTDKPVTMIISTHMHADHTGNNDLFGGPKVESITQENSATNMATMDAFKGEKAKFLPTKTFKDRMTIGAGPSRIDLYYFGRGHTNGDTWVVFPALRVVHAGDMFAWKDGPSCDHKFGGSCVEWPATLAKAVAGIKNVDTVIGGHLPLATFKDLEEYQRYTSDVLAATRAAMQAGKTVDEAASSMTFGGKYRDYETTRLKAAVQSIYDELKP